MGSYFDNSVGDKRDPLSAKDINGSTKVNQFGQKLQKPEYIPDDQFAGKLPIQTDNFNNYYGAIMQDENSKNRSRVFNHINPDLDEIYAQHKENTALHKITANEQPKVSP